MPKCIHAAKRRKAAEAKKREVERRLQEWEKSKRAEEVRRKILGIVGAV